VAGLKGDLTICPATTITTQIENVDLNDIVVYNLFSAMPRAPQKALIAAKTYVFCKKS
jgi:hypothetical protein